MSKTIGVVLALKDKCSPAIVQVAQKFGMAENEAKKLNAQLRQQAKQVDGALKNAIQGTTVAIGAAVGAVSALTSKTMQAGDNIDKMSQKIGMGRKQYQEWDYIMSQNGGSVDNLQMGYKTLAAQMDKAAQKSKNTANVFAQLGVSIKDANGQLRSQEDVFNDSVRALQKIQNPTEKAILSQKLFGKAALDMKPLLNQSAESVDNLRQKANDLGLIMSDKATDGAVQLTDTMDTLQRTFGAIGITLGAQFIPIVQNLADELIYNLPQIKAALIPAFSAFADTIGFVCNHLDVIIPAVGALAGAFGALQIITSATGFIAAFCNPVGLAAVGIGTLIAGLGVAYAKPEGFRTTVGAAVSIIKLLIAGVGQAVTYIGNLGISFTACLGPIGLVIEGLKKLFSLLNKNSAVTGVLGKVKTWADDKTNQINQNVNNTKTPKAHALGTAFSSGGAALVGEYGPEIVNLPQGANVVPADKTRGVLNNNNSNITVNLNVAGNVLGNHEFLNEMMNLMAMEIRKALPA